VLTAISGKQQTTDKERDGKLLGDRHRH